MEKAVNNIIALFILIGCYGYGIAQESTPPLERKISLELNGTTIKETLKLMEIQGDYLFAYRTNLIEESVQLTRTYTDKTTRAILNDLFAGKIVYKERGNYIILRAQGTPDDKTVQMSGYVSNKVSGETIPYATLYDSITLTSANSNEYGYYNLTLKNAENPLIIVKKEGYRDTTIQWAQSGTSVYNIRLEALPAVMDSTLDTLDKNAKIDWFQRFIPDEEQKSTFKNFREQLQRKTQVSFVPKVGTNGNLSSRTTVDYSFNVLGGFNGGARVLEIGGLFNLDWDSVSYFQAAGIFNKVGGHQRGAQFAGITNINNADVHGAQFAGITNITNGEVIGTQSAGIVNSAKQFKGGQFAGIANYSYESSIGGQFAGIFNQSKGMIKGVQVAGILNVADSIQGAQIGLINVSNSINGVPIGLFSFSRRGLHQLEISTNEAFHLNVAFRTGVNQFYNTLVGGVKFNAGLSGEETLISYGYGLGTSIRTSRKSRLFFDFQAMRLHRNGFIWNLNAMGKFAISYQWQITPLFAVAAGPSFNAMIVKHSSTSSFYNYYSLAPNSIYTVSFDDHMLRTWVGGHIALRFF